MSNYVNFCNWDDTSFFRPGTIQLTGLTNPYKENTLEYILVNYVMSLSGLTTEAVFCNYRNKSNHQKNILDILVVQKIDFPMDVWNISYILSMGFWLSLNSGAVEVKTIVNKNIKKPIFALYLESGLSDLFNDSKLIFDLKRFGPNPDYTNHLLKVLGAFLLFKKEFKLPSIQEISKNNQYYYEFHNIERYLMERMEQIPATLFNSDKNLAMLENSYFPRNTWNTPRQGDVSSDTRGLFHHIGDELGFMMAAIQYGECYIVGNDEFGNLLNLHSLQGKDGCTIKMGQIVSSDIFDYIYSIPKSNAMYPGKNNKIFNYTTNSPTLPNLESYWKNKTFQKYAGRYLEDVTIMELTHKLQNAFEGTIAANTLGRLINALDQIFNKAEKLTQLIEETNLEYISSCCIGLESKDILLNYNENLVQYCAGIITHILAALAINGKMILNHKEYELEIEQHYQKIIYFNKNNTKNINHLISNKDLYFYKNSIKNINTNKIFKNFESNNEKILDNIKDLRSHIMSIELLLHDFGGIENINRKIENNFKYFYKTIAHKVHCEIINPPDINSLGFFLKSSTKNKLENSTILDNKINLSSFIEYIFSLSNKFKQYDHELGLLKRESIKLINAHCSLAAELFNNYLLCSLGSTQPYPEYSQLLYYWNKKDIKSLVISELIDMQNEYRIFIVNGKIAAGSPCFRNTTPLNAWERGRMDPRLCVGHSAYDTTIDANTRKRVSQYAKFARTFCQELKKTHPKESSFVLDIAYSEGKHRISQVGKYNHEIGKVVPIEINSIDWSGAYQIDFRRVCAAYAKKRYKKTDMNYWGMYHEILQKGEKYLSDLSKNSEYKYLEQINKPLETENKENIDMFQKEIHDFKKLVYPQFKKLGGEIYLENKNTEQKDI